jgi:hypothetical protein
MLRAIGCGFVVLLAGAFVAINDSNARAPQDNSPEWLKYEAVRKIYKLGFPVVSAIQVVVYDVDKNTRPACEEIVFKLDTKTIGHISVRVRRYFHEEYHTDWSYFDERAKEFPSSLKELKAQQQALDKCADEGVEMCNTMVEFAIDHLWSAASACQLLKKVNGMEIVMGSSIAGDDNKPTMIGNTLATAESGTKWYGTMDENIVEVVGQLRRAHSVTDKLSARLPKDRTAVDRMGPAQRELYAAQAEFAMRYSLGYHKVVEAMKASLNQ